MISRSRRTLLPALAVSVLLHVVALSGAPRSSPPPLPAEAAALNAVLRAPAPSAASAAPARVATKPSPAATTPRPSVVEAPTMAGVAPPSVVASADPPPQPLPSAASGQATTPAVSGGASPSASVGAAQAASGAPGRQAVSGDDLRQYRLSLASAARRFKRYPALASQRGWEGTVEVALDFSASSSLPEVVLLRSSGRAVLDEQALAMLSQAARVSALPEGLKARDFRIVLPVLFSLDSDQ